MLTMDIKILGVLSYVFVVATSASILKTPPLEKQQLVSTKQQASKPHIMFLLVDDWGWADVGYHRNSSSEEIVTPNIDNLVKEGLELDQHYSYI